MTPGSPPEPPEPPAEPLVRAFRPCEYATAEPLMQAFTFGRDAGTRDEIWLVEHPPVFTMGRASRARHLRDPGTIPVVRTERGGQVTYHGPGQVVAYLLVDLRRRSLTVRAFVDLIESATIEVLQAHGIDATRRPGAPGVYTLEGDAAGPKIASLGIRVSRGCTYHGIALNVDMDLEPFSRIDPCGYPGQPVTDMRSCSGAVDVGEVAACLGLALAGKIGARARARAGARAAVPVSARPMIR